MDAVLSFWGLPPKSSKCLDVPWPKWTPWGQEAMRFPCTRNSSATTVGAGGKGGGSFHLTQPSREETPTPEWQTGQLSAKKGGGVRRPIPQH